MLIVIARVFANLTPDHRENVCEALRTLYNRQHEVMQVPLHVAFTVRIIGQLKNLRNQSFLHKCYEDEASTLVRREIIVVYPNWTNFGWLSVQIKRFHTMDLGRGGPLC